MSLPHFCDAQSLSGAEVWQRFFSIVSLPPEKQVGEFRKLELICKSTGIIRDSVYTNLLALYSSAEYLSGNKKAAVKRLRAAIRIAESNPKGNPPHYLSKFYFYLPMYAEESMEYQARVSCYRKSIDYGSKGIDKWGIAPQSCLFLSYVYKELRDYNMSLEFAALGSQLALSRKDTAIWLNNLNEKIESLFYLGRTPEALSESQLLLRFAGSHASPFDQGRFYKVQGDILSGAGRFETAMAFYKRAASRFLEAADLENLGVIYVDLHYLNVIRNNQLEAKRYFFLAQKHPPDKYQLSRLLDNEALNNRNQGNYAEALKYVQQSLAILPGSRVAGNKPEQNPNSKWAASIYRKDFIFDPIQNKADIWLDYAKKTGNDKAGLRHAMCTYLLADTLIDYIRWEHQGSATKLFWRAHTRSFYERAIETCYLLGDPEKAFYFFEKSRAVMLNDQLNELGANQLLSRTDQETESAMKRKVNDLQNKLAKDSLSQQEIESIRTRLFVAQKEQADFFKRLETTNPQYFTYKYNNATPNIAQLKSGILANDQTFVSYFVGDFAVYGLSVGPGKTVLRKIDLEKYSDYSGRFQKMIASKDVQNQSFDEFLAVSNQLYELLLKPFGIPFDTRVVVSPDGGLIPFEAMSASARQAEYLVSKYAFSYTYSAGFIAKSLKKRKPGFFDRPFIGLAPVRFAPFMGQQELPGSDQALKIIEQHFFIPKILTDVDASRKAFIKESSKYRIVQLFTHATADNLGNTPTLYFADSTLEINELSANVNLATTLLVLSACRTAIGKNQRGEGIFSLARGFAGIGIPSTVTTLWSVENEATYGLTALFYQEMAKELPLDVALQQAQMKWLEGAGPSDRLPYVWAGLVLVGNAQEVDLGIPGYFRYVLMGGLLVFLVFLFYSCQRRSSRN